MSKFLAGVAALVVLPLLALVILLSSASSTPANASGGGVGGGLAAGAVPAADVPWVSKAAATCPVLTPSLVAAQTQTESGWNPNAVSPVGAEGLAQFMPGTWPGYGRDDNGDGTADPFDPPDAIMALARYDCALYDQVSGLPSADKVALMLAAYNAGPGAVLAASGIPPYPETQAYVQTIEALAAKLAGPPAAGPVPVNDPVAAKAIAFARSRLGLPYQWGGTGPLYDCSGLTQASYAYAGVALPRTTPMQFAYGPRIPVSTIAPGDLIFFASDGTAAAPGHVAIYLGGGQMLDAPHTGAVLHIGPLWGTPTGATRPAALARH